MKKSLIIVESPAKIKTLRKLLGSGYEFASSVGHIRDLPEKEFGIDTEGDFDPTYEVLADQKQIVKDLIKEAKRCEKVYLSPDPDREGEAIAWHIAQILPKGTKILRATFNSITKAAVEEALANPREIDQGLVLNVTNARSIADMHGGDTDEWTGKKITLCKVRVDFAGKVVNAIRVVAPSVPF